MGKLAKKVINDTEKIQKHKNKKLLNKEKYDKELISLLDYFHEKGQEDPKQCLINYFSEKEKKIKFIHSDPILAIYMIGGLFPLLLGIIFTICLPFGMPISGLYCYLGAIIILIFEYYERLYYKYKNYKNRINKLSWNPKEKTEDFIKQLEEKQSE